MAAGVSPVLQVVVLAGLLPRYWSQTNFFLKPLTLTLTPGINDTYSHKVSMNCSIRTNVSRIESLSIVNVTNGMESVIVNATWKNESNGSFPAQLTAVIPWATVSGSIGQQFIAMTLNRISCYNEALYGCRAFYIETPPNVVNERVTQNLTVNVSPGQLNMTASPAGKTSWKVGDKLKLTCAGPVGRVREKTKIEWKWEYSDSGDVWIPCVGGDNITENHTDKRPTQPVSSTCYQTQTSTQQLQLAEEDTNRTYRCSVLSDGRLYDEFAAVYSVGSVEPHGDNTDASNQFSGATIGGIIAGSLIAVLVISSVAYLFIIQRRRQKESSDDASSVDSGQSEPEGGHDEKKTEKGQSTEQETTASETGSEISDLHSSKEEATDVETASETSDLQSSKEKATDVEAATE